MATFTKTKSGTWRAEVRINKDGKRIFRKIGHFDTKAAAQAWANDLEVRAKETIATGRTLPTAVSLREAVEVWEQDLKEPLNNSLQGR